MQRRIYLLATLLACLLVIPATAEARGDRAHRTATQPTSAELLDRMLTAADEWWTGQGSPPPCPMVATVEWGTAVEGYSGFAFYNSCTIVLSPHWWATQYAFLTSRSRLGQRQRISAQALALIIHERGHNIGYRHIPGTVMQEGTPVVPGWCFTWAARTIR